MAVGGDLTADVSAGLPAGEYRIASINSAANHQPALSAVAQRGSNDDISYVSVDLHSAPCDVLINLDSLRSSDLPGS